MIELTPDAKRRFEEYLQRTRRALHGTRAVEADEVEQNVIEHVELALAGVPAPVGADPLRRVLEQLGPPERWLPDEEQPWWRRAMGRLMNGPEDWRLAYLCFGVTVAMIVFFPVGGVTLLPIAFLISRAYVQLMQERGEPLGARGWLVAPPIVFALVLFLGLLLFAVPAIPAAMAAENGMWILGFKEPPHRFDRVRILTGATLLWGGGWWMALSGLFALMLRPMRWLFAPVLGGLRRVHLLVLTMIGAAAAGIGALLLWGV